MSQPEASLVGAASGGRGVTTTATACAALTTAMLPVFLVGALGPQLQRDLDIDETGLGAAVTLLFVVAAVAAPLAGRVAERRGATTALRSGVLLAGALAGLVGATADSWWQLALPLAGVGVAIGLVDTGAARAFADEVPPARQGRAFGIKEASVPAASLLAGLAVPTVAAAVGWRWAFAVALLVALVVLTTVGRGRTPLRRHTDAPGEGPPPDTAPAVGHAGGAGPDAGRSMALAGFAAAAGLGGGAATAAATFMVPAMAARGFAAGSAGLVLSTASVGSIAARVLLGRWADRRTARPTNAVAALCLAGGLAAAVLAMTTPPVVAVGAAVLVLTAGWGWTGLAFLSAVRAHPQTPATAAGIVLSGIGAGGALGPLAFGALAGRLSYTVAWSAAAGAFLMAAAGTAIVRRRLGAERHADRGLASRADAGADIR